MRGLYGLSLMAASVALLAAMFGAVHRGAKGRERARVVETLEEQRLALEAQRAELMRRIEQLSGRSRVVQAAAAIGLRLPGEGELVILELPGSPGPAWGGGR